MRNTLLLALFLSSAAIAEVVSIDIATRTDIANGKSWGLAGPYERLAGTIHYAVDPAMPANQIVRDINHAPRNADGQIEFSADFHLIKPKDILAGNGAVVLDVMIRGRKRILRYFNNTNTNDAPLTEADFGDGFLLEQGFTILNVGWQFDVPNNPNTMRAYVPIATDDGAVIEGLVRSDFVVRERTFDHSLGDRNHRPYAVVRPDDPRNILTVREAPDAERTVINRDAWQFGRHEDGRAVADPTRVYLASGFEPDKIYEVVFVSRNPPVAGLGLAAMRDAISQLKYGTNDELDIPADSIDRAIAFGDSQAGRYLRNFLYDGFNADEEDRIVFDGMLSHIAANARGSFNHRFAQPSRAIDVSFEYPGDQFPFSDVPQEDPVTGVQDSLLGNVSAETTPKVFYTNSSTEYWRLPAALIHTSPDGLTDVPHADSSRIYFLSGTQHVPSSFPQERTNAARVGNHNDYTWFLRSLLLKLDDWIRNGSLPPESHYPKIADDTLVNLESLTFPRIPGVARPNNVMRTYSLDYGPEFATRGIISQEPAHKEFALPFLIPQIDDAGNEIAGLKSPELAVPLATYTGWNHNSPNASPGYYIPFAPTRAERERTGDSRLSVEERYTSREHYIGLVAGAALTLIDDGYLLRRDLPAILHNAGRHWDYLLTQ